MKILILTITLYGFVLASHIEAAYEEAVDLYAPSLSSGGWGYWDLCEEGTVARGFRLKVNFKWMNYYDDEALCGIQLLCGTDPFPNFINAPTSWYRTEDSSWQETRMCPHGSYIESFNLRQDRSDDFFHDKRGATSLKVKCSEGSVLHGDGIENEGVYTGWLDCPKGKGISGLRTKVDDSTFDNEGLVTVIMRCQNVYNKQAISTTESIHYGSDEEINNTSLFRSDFAPNWLHLAINNRVTVNSTSLVNSYNSTIATPVDDILTIITLPFAHTKVNETETKLNETETTLNETEAALNETETTLNETEATLNEAETILNETELKINETESTVNETKTKVNETETNIIEKKKKANETETNITDTKMELEEVETKEDETETKINTSALEIISNYKDPYFKLPIVLIILILIVVGIFFFIAGFLFKKIYLVKFQEKSFEWAMKADTSLVKPIKCAAVKVEA